MECASSRNLILFRAFVFLMLVRIFISDGILNLVMNYSSTGGMILEKIHPASWGFMVLAAYLAPRIFSIAVPPDRHIFAAMLVMMVMTCLGAFVPLINGSSDLGLGYLVDTVLMACAAACTLLVLPATYRRAVGDILLSVLVINSVLALAEFALKIRLLPSPREEWIFRAQGLLSHPLELGLCNAVASAFVSLTNWSPARKFLSISVLITATVAAGARTASITLPVVVLMGFLAPDGSGQIKGDRSVKIILVAAIVALAPAMWFLLELSGLGERFDTLGLADESANARIIIFQVFALSGWRDLVFGAGLETLTRLARVGLKLPYVENSIVVYIFQFGMIGTAFLVCGFICAFHALWRHAPLQVKAGILAFFIVALSANTLSTKSPDIMLIFVLAITFRAASQIGEEKRPKTFSMQTTFGI